MQPATRTWRYSSMMPGERRIRKAAVTGAAGFIGAELVRALADRGVEVRALVRDIKRVPNGPGVEPFQCDIVQRETIQSAFQDVDTVFHAAALVGGITAGEAALRLVNVEGTRHVVQAAAQSGSVRRFVHISTVGVVGRLDSSRLIEEGEQPNPRNAYGRTKLESERVALACAGSMELVIPRPMWVYGERSASTAKLFRTIARHKMILIGRARNLVQPVYIQDLIRGLMRCGEAADLDREVIQFAGPSQMTTGELCVAVAEALGVPPPAWHAPFWVANAGAAVFERVFAGTSRKLPIDNDKIDFFRLHHAYSMAKAARLLAWTPEVSFEDASRRIAAFLRAVGSL
jgi:nucleoside-diphosphate-sugar epimerase